MKAFNPPKRLPLRQRGMATILIIVLTGMALTVTALGVMYSVRTSQEQQVTVHAATHSQSGVWAAAKALGLYLEKLDEEALIAFNPDKPLEFNINNNPVVAKVFSLTSAPEPRIRAEISYTDIAAKSTSTLEVIYNIALTSQGNQVTLPSTTPGGTDIIIKSDLTLSGNMKFLTDGPMTLTVIGNISFNNNDMENISIRSTEDITLNEKINVYGLYSHKSINISKNPTVTLVNAAGNITIEDATVTNANALGDIEIGDGATIENANAGGKIEVNGSKKITVTSASAVGNITIRGAPVVRYSQSMGTVTCPSDWKNNNYTSIKAAKDSPHCKSASKDETLSISEPAIAQNLTAPKIDAYQFKNAANYVFKGKNEQGNIEVDVKSVTGINETDIFATYYLVNGDTLCKPVNGVCESNSEKHKVCVSSACITYKDREWELSGKKGDIVLAPGILWFEGSLKLNKGTYHNSLIATGNITGESNTVVYAANYDYSKTCKNSSYPPANLCDNAEKALITSAAGNIALLAGGYNHEGVFSGGGIKIGSNQEYYGSVLAGDAFDFYGGPSIYGYITTAGQQYPESTYKWNGNITVDVRNLPDSYNPGGSYEDTGGAASEVGTAEILWSRYL